MSIASLRSRLTRGRGDDGIALIELIVSMVITLIMLTLIGRMFAQVTHAAGDNQSTRAATGVAATVADEITRVVRQGVLVTTSSTTKEGAVIAGSTATSLNIDSAVDATVTPGQAAIAPTRVVFSVDGSGSLVEQRFAGTVTSGSVTFASSPTSSRTVNGPILTTGASVPALFAYTDGSGNAVLPSSGGLTAAQASSVAAVTVTVTVANSLSTGSDPVQITNEVTMPNIAIANGGY
ncbi:MAG: hypothetical protein HIU86_11655 [Acidobacteria bacterium]|nr:hypothetical protein [Acidobacteriota bacterium]